MISKGLIKPLLPTDEKTPASLNQFADAARQSSPVLSQGFQRIQQHLERIYGILQSVPQTEDEILITDENGKIIAWIGSRDQYTGAYFAQLYVGGDGPDTANLFVDGTGTLNIRNAIIVIQKDGATTTLGNYIDAYGTMGIQIKNDTNGFKTAVGDRGLFVWNNAETAVIAEVANNSGSGVATVYNPATGKYARMTPGNVEVYSGPGIAVTIENGNIQLTGSGISASMPVKMDASKKFKTEKIDLAAAADVTGTGLTTSAVLVWDGSKLASISVASLASLVSAYFSTGNHAHLAGPMTTEPGGTDGHTHSILATNTSPPV